MFIYSLKCWINWFTFGMFCEKTIDEVYRYGEFVQIRFSAPGAHVKKREKIITKLVKTILGKDGKNLLITDSILLDIEQLKSEQIDLYAQINSAMYDGSTARVWVDSECLDSIISKYGTDYIASVSDSRAALTILHSSILQSIQLKLLENVPEVCTSCGGRPYNLSSCWCCGHNSFSAYFPDWDLESREEAYKLYKGYVLVGEPKKKFLPVAINLVDIFSDDAMSLIRYICIKQDEDMDEVNKVQLIKMVREETGLGLKEAKAKVDDCWDEFYHDDEEDDEDEEDGEEDDEEDEDASAPETIGDLVKRQLSDG